MSDHYKNWIVTPWIRENTDVNEAGGLIRQEIDYYGMLGWLIGNMITGNKFVQDPGTLADREVRLNKVPLIQIVKELDRMAIECFSKALEAL